MCGYGGMGKPVVFQDGVVLFVTHFNGRQSDIFEQPGKGFWCERGEVIYCLKSISYWLKISLNYRCYHWQERTTECTFWFNLTYTPVFSSSAATSKGMRRCGSNRMGERERKEGRGKSSDRGGKESKWLETAAVRGIEGNREGKRWNRHLESINVPTSVKKFRGMQ